MRVSFKGHDSIPAPFRQVHDAPRLMFAAAALTDGDEAISLLDCWAEGDDQSSIGLYVLTSSLLILVEGNDEPVGTVWKLADIKSVGLSEFKTEREFSGEQVVGFDRLELRFSGSTEPVRVPSYEKSSARSRQEFLGALWSAWRGVRPSDGPVGFQA